MLWLIKSHLRDLQLTAQVLLHPLLQTKVMVSQPCIDASLMCPMKEASCSDVACRVGGAAAIR